VGHLVHDARRPRRRQRAARLDEIGERLALDELHREIDQAVGRLAEVIDAADVRVREPRRVARLAIEARDRVGIGVHPRMHHLERALAAHLHVLGQVDGAHPAFAELLDHVVAIGDHLAEEIARGAGRSQRRAVARADALAEGILGPAGRADFLFAHKLSTRRVWSPIRIFWPAFTGRSPRTAIATPLRLPRSSTMNSRSSLRISAWRPLIVWS